MSAPGRHERALAALDFDALVFDMDGLLLDTERLALRALREAGEEIGLAMPEALCRSMIGVAADRSRLLFFEHHGAAAPADALFANAMRRFEAQVDAGLLRLKPGVTALLDRADEASLPCAVATSSARAKALNQLRIAGILERFAAVVTRDDVSHGKPNPDLYLHAARALMTPPGRCLAFEDSYNGVRAAHAAGMSVIMVPDLLPPTDEMRDLCLAIVANLHAVVPLLGAAAR
jgi:HAD superfamily hydrolase (TIGR01509 family)